MAELRKNNQIPGVHSKKGLIYFANMIHYSKQRLFSAIRSEGMTESKLQPCFWSIIPIRELCRRWRHVPGKESICFHTDVISNKERWGSSVIWELDRVHIRSAFSVVKTVSYARLFLYTLWKTFLSFTRVQRETRDPGKDFRKMIFSEFCHKLYPGSEARSLGENKFKLIKTLKGHTGHQTALSKLHLQINLKTCGFNFPWNAQRLKN